MNYLFIYCSFNVILRQILPMKRIVIYIIISQFLFLRCSSPEKETTKEVFVPVETQQFRDIKACRIYSSEFAILDSEDKGRLIQEYRFNKKGFVNELIRYGMDGEIIAQFDIYGQDNPFPHAGKPVFSDTVLTVTSISNDGEVSKKEIKKYNEVGLLVEASLYLQDGSLIQKNTYAYDPNDRIAKDVYWDVDLNEPMQVVRYEYEFYLPKK